MIAAEISGTNGLSDINRFYGYNKESGVFKSAIDYQTTFPLYGNLSMGQSIPTESIHYPESFDRKVSFLGNVTYSYKNRYVIYGSARKDGSNVFGVNTNRKWHPLWSTAASWDISKENFL